MVGLCVLPLSAQNVVDANRFGSQNITGTARYRAMGGAFGALGGDPSCMTDNPAGMGIYRGTSSISFTPNLSFAHTNTNGSEVSKQKKVDCSVSNLAYVLSIRTPHANSLVNFNIGVGFNHSEGLSRKYKLILDEPTSSFGDYLANRANNCIVSMGYYNNPDYVYLEERDKDGYVTYSPWDDNQLPLTTVAGYNCYAIDQVKRTDNGVETREDGIESRDQHNSWASYQRLYVTEMNRNEEYNLNFSANWDDFIYAGLTLSIDDFNSTIETEFNEDYDYLYQGDFTQSINALETKGRGFGAKLGILVKPTDTWRIGFAAHTPTWYHMEDLYSIRMLTSDPNCKDYSKSGTYSYEYKYYSPYQLQLSSAWVLGGRALLSAEVDMKDYATQRYRSDNDGGWDEGDEMEWIDDYFKRYNRLQMTYKLGGEFRVTDHFSVRAGYAFKASPYDQNLYDNPEASRGWYEGNNWGDENTTLFDSSTKPNYSFLGNQQFFSAGVGWSGEWWNVDLSCMNRHIQEKIAAFPTTDALVTDGKMYNSPSYGAVKASHRDMKTNVLQWDLTIGLRF